MEKKLLSILFIFSLFFLNPVEGFGQCNGTASVTITSEPTNAAICEGASIKFTAKPENVGTPTYQWRVNALNQSGENGSTFTTSSLQNGDVVSVFMNPGCTGETSVPSNNIAVNVNPIPSVTTANTATICSGTGSNISLTASMPSSFSWTIGAITGSITGASAGSGATINQTLTNPSNSTAGTVQYIVTPTSTAGNCEGTPYTITVTVNPTPSVTTANTATICSGAGPNISLTASTSSSFSWTVGTITGSITGASNGSGVTINQTLTNPSNSTAGTVQYIVTPIATSGSCAGNPYTITVTVNPTPSVTTANTATICSGTGPDISLTASTPSSFSWTIGMITGGITGASTGSGATINQTLTNPSNSTVGTVQYIVTPAANTGSCAGTPYTITVTVNPRPTVTTSNTATICSGTGPDISLTASTSSTFSWTIGNITGGITGASAGNGSTINQTLTNPNNSTAGTVQYIVTPTANSGSCAGSPYTITVTVNPRPTVTTASTATICSGTGPNISLAASTPSTFSYTVSSITGNISGASAGTGATINQTLTNPSNSTAGTVQYIVTPTATAGGCPGTPYPITVTVNPRPTITTASAATVCSGFGPNISLAASSPSSFSWTIGVITGGITGASAGSGASINQALSNPSNSIAGTVQYIVTPTATAGSCAGTPLTITVTVNPTLVPSVSITSSSTSICSSPLTGSTAVTFTATPVNGATPTYQWKNNGVNISGQTGATYIANSLPNPSQITVEMTSTATCASPAMVTSSNIIMVVNSTAPGIPGTITTTAPESICPVATGYTFSVAAVANATSYVWDLPTGWVVTSGNGTRSITVDITGSASNGPNRYVYVQAQNGCGISSARQSSKFTVDKFAAVDAGSDQSICAGSSINLAGVLLGAASSGAWSASSGSFTNVNANNATATYTPSINSGTVTLTLTPNTPGGSCTDGIRTDQMVLTVIPPATAVAGTAITACSNAAININAGSSASNNAGILWTSNGTGTIANPTSLTTATYTPGAGETGPVTLTLTAIGNNPCADAESTKTLTISQAATAVAGIAVTACSNAAVSITEGSSAFNYAGILWTSNGTGIIANPTSLTTATYTPGSGETEPVTLTLTATGNTPCADAVSTKTLTISQAATAVAGIAVTACSNAAVSITEGSSASNYAGILWTSNGTGTITNPTSLTTATYTPGSGETGPVTLTLTATGNTPCADAVSTKTLTISLAPTAVAGTAITACSNAAINITAGSSATNNTEIIWTSTGTGTIANPTSLTTATYTPGNGETGPVTLTLTATGNTPCTDAVSTKTLTISQAATAVAGIAVTACSNAAVSITEGSSASNYSGILWTSNGTGTIANPTSLTTATYTPGSGETEPVTLTLTATGNTPCADAVSTKTLTISQAATAVAGIAVTACSNAAVSITEGSSASNYAGILWTSNGTGTITNPTSLTTATYTPGSGETGPVTLTLTAAGNTPCADAVSTKTLTINQEVIITTQPTASQTICSGFPVSFSVTATGTGITYEWLKDDAPIGITTSTLSFSQVTLANAGTYKVIVKGAGPCGDVTSNEAVLIVNENISITNQPTPVEICEDANTTISVAATGTGLTYQWRKGGIPISDDAIVTGTTSNTLVFTKALAGNVGSYDVVISGEANTCSQIISNPAALKVNLNSTISLSSASGTDSQTLCINSSITPITYAIGGGGTGATITAGALPTGLNGIYNAGVFTISGTPTEAGNFNYTVTTTGNCTNESLSGTINVTPGNTIILSSAAATTNQDLCVNTQITTITYTTTGATDATFIGLPAGVTGSWANNTVTISGTPTESGTFNYTVTTEGPCDQESLSGTIIVNPAPVATISSEHQNLEICFDGAAYNITAGAAAENYSSILWTVPSGSGTIANENSLTEATFTPASGVSNATITLTAYGLTGCTDVIVTKEISIQPLPTVSAITYGEGVTEFCDDEASPQPAVTGTNEYNGGIFSWAPAQGEPGSNTLNLNTTTGLISSGSDPGKYDVTYSTPTGAICGVISNSIEITITKLLSTVFNYTKIDYCITDLNASVAEGYDTGGTFTSETLGSALNPNTGVISWQLTNTNLIGSHTITYTIPPAGGCEPVSHSQTINIDPIPQGGVLSFGTFGRIFVICENPGNDYAVDLNLTGSVGRVVAWKYRTSSATTWSDLTINGVLFTGTTIPANVLEGLIAAGGMQSMVFRVQLASSGCSSSVFSETGIVSVISSSIIEPSPVQISDDVICIGDEVTLTAAANYLNGPDIADGGEFGNSSITQGNNPWRIDRDPKGQFESSANNRQGEIWKRANPQNYFMADINDPYTVRDNIRWASDGQPGFAIASGNRTSTLETPIFNIDGIDQAILIFDQAYNLTPGASIRVEISTNGGNTYLPDALYERTGPLRSENFGDFSAGDITTRANNKIRIDLGNFMGQGNLRIQFKFIGARDGDVWALDNIDIPDGPRDVSTVWTDYTDPNNPIEVGRSNTQTWTPEKIGLNTIEVQRFIIYNSNGDKCENFTPPVEKEVFVFDNYTSTATAQPECGKYGVPIQATVNGSDQGAITSYPTPDGFIGQWQVAGPEGYAQDNSHFKNADGSASSSTNPNAVFNPNQFGNFTISWTLTQEDGREIICTNTINPFTFEIQDIYTSTATAQVGLCGDSSIQLVGQVTGLLQEENISTFPTPDGYIATWIVTGPTGYTFSEGHFTNDDNTLVAINDPNAIFTPGMEGEFILRWSLTREGVENAICVTTYTDATFTLVNCTALDFDGVDDYVDLGENYTGNGYSFEAWVKPVSSGGTIISGPQFNITAPVGLSTTRWTHIAVTGGILYLDGVASGAPPDGTVGARALIGARWNGTAATNNFHGWIEEVRIWNGTITPENIRFTMNQRLKGTGNIGEVVDMVHPDAPDFGNLAGYYRLISAVPDPANLVSHAANLLPTNGTTIDLATNSVPGILKNMTTNQQNTAPLPYISGANGVWDAAGTWARGSIWDLPNNNIINWNIVRLLHNVNSPRDITVLGIDSQSGTLNMVGTIPAGESHTGVGTGNALTISHYLKLDGIIDLNGESQLLQPDLSIVDPASTGHLDRDQQGKRNSFIYNYWSSPVSISGPNTANNGGYSVGGVLLDGTDGITGPINFQPDHWAADGDRQSPIIISTYWLWGYSPAPANVYAEWDHIRKDGSLESGEGFTMKGTDGNAGLNDGQNYTFRGKPHNGDITLPMGPNQNYLIGNPYPSALDATQFITDHLGTNPVFDGSLYFWDHFVVVDHILKEYIGGYAVRNLTSGVPAASVDDRINNTGQPNNKYPGPYIPVGQGFLINSTNPNAENGYGGIVKFKNSQREFEIEGDESIFLRPEKVEKTAKSKESEFKKIRLSFSSPVGYWRQILVGAVPNATDGFDLGYDAHLFDDNIEDMYFLQGENKLVIQAVSDFNKDRVIPLGIKVKENKEFRIRLDTLENGNKEMNIYLNDKLKDSIHDLRASAYISTSEPGTIHDRFEIIFHKEEPLPPAVEIPGEVDENDEIYKEFGISVRHGQRDRELQILNPHELSITNMYIFDLNGNKLEGHKNLSTEKEFRMSVRNYSSGVYIVQIVVEGRVVSKKIIISN